MHICRESMNARPAKCKHSKYVSNLILTFELLQLLGQLLLFMLQALAAVFQGSCGASFLLKLLNMLLEP